MSPAEDKNRQTLSHLLDYLNNPKTTPYAPDQIWGDKFIEKRPWPFQKGHGRDSFVKFLAEIHDAFANYHVEMPLIIGDGDDAAVRMVVTGTHTAPFQGIAPTAREVHWELLAHMKFKEGLIEEQETFRDWMELMSQLQWPASTS